MAGFGELENKILQLEKDSKICVLMHDNPDPDSIAVAYFCKEVLNSIGISETYILSGGNMDEQTRKFCTSLGIYDNLNYNKDPQLHNIYHWNYDTNKKDAPHLYPQYFNKFIFADHNGNNSRWARERKIQNGELAAIIDHHNCDNAINAQFIDCREIGSASSIIVEYLEQGAKEYFNKEKLDTLYQLLHLGIHVDTNYLRNGATKKDIEMIKKIAPMIDYSLFSSFSNFKRKGEWMDAYGRAYVTREPVCKGANIASIGNIKNSKVRGALPIAANDLLKEDKINTIILFGFDEKYVDFAIRTEKKDFDYKNLVESFPGAIGGGRESAGRMQVPTSYFINGKMDYNERTIEEKEYLIKEKMKKYINT